MPRSGRRRRGRGNRDTMVGMAMGRDCWAHRHQEDVPLEDHHIWPLGEGGPDKKANRIRVCSNAHSATHDLLAKLKKGPVAWTIRRRYGVRVRALAIAGLDAMRTREVHRPPGA